MRWRTSGTRMRRTVMRHDGVVIGDTEQTVVVDQQPNGWMLAFPGGFLL